MSKAQADKMKNSRTNNNSSQIGDNTSPNSRSKSKFDQNATYANGKKTFSKNDGRALQRSNTDFWTGTSKKKRQVNRINSVEQATSRGPPNTTEKSGGMIRNFFRMWTKKGSALEEKKPDD